MDDYVARAVALFPAVRFHRRFSSRNEVVRARPLLSPPDLSAYLALSPFALICLALFPFRIRGKCTTERKVEM